MITTQWPQRPPEPVTDLSVWWEGAPRAAADLTRLRREVQAVVGGRSDQDDDADGLDRLLLIFEEPASNGLRHGRPPVRVLLATVPTGWLLDVSDAAADRPPIPARGRDAADGGMGLPLVARLAAAHGWTVYEDRKHVWALIEAVPVSWPPNGGAAPPPPDAPPPGGGGAPGGPGPFPPPRGAPRPAPPPPAPPPHPRRDRRPCRRPGLPAGAASDRSGGRSDRRCRHRSARRARRGADQRGPARPRRLGRRRSRGDRRRHHPAGTR